MNSDIWTVGERRLYTGKDPFDDDRDDEITVARRNPFAGVEEQAGAPGPMEAKALESGHIEWLELDLTAKADEKNWVPVVKKLLQGQRQETVRAYRRFVQAEGLSVSDESMIRFLGEVSDYLDGPGLIRAQRALRPIIRATAMQAAQRATARVGLSFDVVLPGIEKYVADLNQWLAKSLNETTAANYADIVQKAMAERSTFDEIFAKIQAEPDTDAIRATFVARTETTRIANATRLETAKVAERETGRVMRKRWISSRDDRTRDTHRENDDGEYYPLDYVWPTGSSVPDEYNCRCVLTFRADDGGATVGAET